MFHGRFFREHSQIYTFNARRGAGEILFHKLAVQPDGLKYLRAAIALQRGNSHLGKHFEEALVDPFDVVGERFLKRDALAQQPAEGEIFQGFNGEIGIYRAGSVTDEERIVHDFARLAGFHNQRYLSAQAFADQVVVYRGESQQAGDGRFGRVHAAIGKNEQVIAGMNRQSSAAAERIELTPETGISIRYGKQRGQSGGQKISGYDAPQLFQITIGNDGLFEFEGVTMLGSFGQNVALRADVADEGHDHVFADGIHGRVGDLGEQLLEVIEQRLRLVG